VLGVSSSLPNFDAQLSHLSHVVLISDGVLCFPGFGTLELMLVSLLAHLPRVIVVFSACCLRVVAAPAAELEVLFDQFCGEKWLFLVDLFEF
jgi:hypothetical protein